jgi:hypothetical protein
LNDGDSALPSRAGDSGFNQSLKLTGRATSATAAGERLQARPAA